MHKPFTPVPRWLDGSMEVGLEDRHLYARASSLSKGRKNGSPLEQALEFQLLCFEALYRLGLSDRQVAEITALTILLHKRFGRITMVPITEEGARKWKEDHPGGSSPRWFREGSRFFWAFSTLEEFFREWMDLHLPRNNPKSGVGQMFWGGSPDWILIFVNGDKREFEKVTERLRVLFAQHSLKVPITGTWDLDSMLACRTFQMRYPKVLMPWKTGHLDGFTYKTLARRWRVQNGLSPFSF